MSRITTSRYLFALALSVALQACGGGGGGGGGNPPADDDGNPPPAPRTLSLFAGNLDGLGNVDGIGQLARFNLPSGMAIDRAGNLFVADRGNYTIRKITPAGVVTTFAGSSGARGEADGVGSAARFSSTYGMAIDSADNLYVVDSHAIRKITPAAEVTTFAGSAFLAGAVDGLGSVARFSSPAGIATDNAGNIYVGDAGNYTIRKITPTGQVTTLAGSAGQAGNVDGAGSVARFGYPFGIATNSSGDIYVTDLSSVRKVTSAGVVTTVATIASPYGIVAANGNVYVGSNSTNTLLSIAPGGTVTTVAGMANVRGSADGTGATASFGFLTFLAADSGGNIYVAEANPPNYHGFPVNHTIRKVTPAGVVTTLAGKAGIEGSANGTGAEAQFRETGALATDSSGNIYAADMNNGRAVRKISPAGQVSSLFVVGNRGIGMRFMGIAVDNAGDVIVADGNNAIIQKFIVSTGALSTLAGTSGVTGSADGIGAAASFTRPLGVATDTSGNSYVTDNRTIRKITPDGTVTTLAGAPGVTGIADGTGTAARFADPEGLAVDSVGNVYVADRGANTIRKMTPAGVVTTLAGSAYSAGSADGNGADARFKGPRGIAIDSVGNLYVADTGNQTVRKITPAGDVTTLVGAVGQNGFTPGDLPAVISSPVGVVVSGGRLYVSMGNGVAVVTGIP